jgi:hypothetical protein
MSRINRGKPAQKTSLNTQPLTANSMDTEAMETSSSVPEDMDHENQLQFVENSTTEEHIARVVFEANATADQLARGHTVRLSSAENIFNVASAHDNIEKGIITGISSKAIYSDCSEPITLSVNLFNTTDSEPTVNNEQGWLHTPSPSDFGVKTTGGVKGFKNLLNLLPYEKTRSELAVYKPEDVANDRYIQQYGSYNNENLWDGVVAFPGEKYYLVHQGHVVLNVIRQNWEQLGINVDDEHRFNGKYVQVPAHVFDRVIKDLEAQVLSRMPFTDLSNIRACFTSKQASNYTETHNDGPAGKFKVVVELEFKYQFPPTTNMSSEEVDNA